MPWDLWDSATDAVSGAVSSAAGFVAGNGGLSNVAGPIAAQSGGGQNAGGSGPSAGDMLGRGAQVVDFLANVVGAGGAIPKLVPGPVGAGGSLWGMGRAVQGGIENVQNQGLSIDLLQNYGDYAANGLGLGSVFAGGPAGLVMGAGAAGYAGGQLLDQGVGAFTGRSLSDRAADLGGEYNQAVDDLTGSDTAGDIAGGLATLGAFVPGVQVPLIAASAMFDPAEGGGVEFNPVPEIFGD